MKCDWRGCAKNKYGDQDFCAYHKFRQIAILKGIYND